MSRAFLTALLDGEYQVTEVADGAAAVDELERRRFDLVVLDATPGGRSAGGRPRSPNTRPTTPCGSGSSPSSPPPRRPYRPAVTHARAVRILTAESQGRFDPTLLAAFAAATPRFEQIFHDYPT
jgi:response regulator RpfG family c-di-GMP phosphodiesterase